jgi:hypothetical protein
MKAFKLLGATALAIFGLALSSRAAPAGIGDSFLSYTYTQSGGGIFGSGLLYFASDGTCRQFLFSSGFTAGPTGEPPTFDISRTGTYTYTPNGDDPTQASVVANISGFGVTTSYVFSLQFIAGTSGSLEFAPQGPNGPQFFAIGNFSLLLHSPNSFLANVSNRVTLRPADTAISGFVIQGGGSRLVLVRAVGPTLAQFGVNPVSMNPQLNLFLGTGTDQIGSGAKWDSGAQNLGGYDAQAMSWVFSLVGAFSLQAGSNDVAYFGVLSPGVYTAQSFDTTTPATGASALTEVYILPYSD